MSEPAPRSMKRSELIAQELTRRIIAENLPPGTRLPFEREMLDEFKVGRGTLREALRLLESRGVITIRTGRDGGPVVRRPEPSDLGAALTLMLEFEGASYLEVFAARRALEPTLAARAAEHISDEQLEQIKTSVDRMAAHPDQSTVYHRENLVFHNVIAEASNNAVLRLLSQAVESVADGLAFGGEGLNFTQEQRQTGIDAHIRIYKALAEHDPEAAQREMEQHLSSASEIWTAALMDMSRHTRVRHT